MADEPGWPEGWALIELGEVDSTMLEAARQAPGLAGPAWILAHRQTSARGRRGRAWMTPSGNLAATALLPVAGGPGEAALRSFTAALALHRALAEVSGLPGAFALKWPNDVLLEGRKLSGILLEVLPGGWLSIGIGVNLAVAPEPASLETRALPPVSLRDALGLEIAPLDFLIHLAGAFADYERQFLDEGFAPLRQAWLGRAVRLGEAITARTGSEEISGIFETIDAQGQMVLRTRAGQRIIPAAEISF